MSFEQVKFGEVCKFVRGPFGGSLKKDSFVSEGYAVYEQQHAIYNTFDNVRYFIGEEKFQSMKRFELKSGDLIMSCSGTMGKISLVPSGILKGVINQALLKITPSKKVDVSYLKYWMESESFQNSINNTNGSAIQNVSSVKILKDVEIPLPPLETQKQIAAVLEKADQLRKDCKQMEQELNSLAQSVFIDMFGDPVTNPKGWEKAAISKVCDVKTGSTPRRGVDGYYEGAIPWVKTGEVVGDYIYDSEEKITPKAIDETNCKPFPVNTILLAMYGQGKTRGRVGILATEAATNQACAAICPTKKIDPLFLFYYLRTQYLELRRLGRGGNQENLNLSMVKDFEIILPPPSGQKAYVEAVAKINELIIKNREGEVEIDNTFNSLMQKAFKGELSLKSTKQVA